MGQEHDSWVHSVFGFDPAAAIANAAKAVAGEVVDIGKKAVDGVEAAGKAVAQAGEAVGKEIVHVGEEVGKEIAHVGEVVVEKVKETFDPAYHCAALNKEFEQHMQRLDAQIKTLTDGGLDASHLTAQAKQLRQDHDGAEKTPDVGDRVTALKKVVDAAKDAADRASADTKRGTTSAVEGIDKAVIDMRDAAKKLIDKIDAKNDAKPDLTKRLDDLNGEIAAEQKLTDRKERNKVLKQVERSAEELLDKAAKVAKDPAAVQGAYKQALLDRYGFKIDDKQGVSSHNDRVYKMFDMVPDTDVTQDKLTELKYSTKMPDGTNNPSAFYWGGDGKQGPEITMGQYSGQEELPYQDPTSKQPESPNAFDISTLHELGHSVDDRYGLMNAHGAKAGGGGWKDETVEDVAKAYIARFKAGPGKATTIKDDVLAASVQGALDGGNTNRPAGVTEADWAALKPLLITCKSRKAGNPWETQDDCSGRSYHHSGNGWVSYLTSSRGMALSVSKYQWRSQAEFFAELYAWTYFNSKPPPNPVEGALKQYMYAGASAAPPAAH